MGVMLLFSWVASLITPPYTKDAGEGDGRGNEGGETFKRFF